MNFSNAFSYQFLVETHRRSGELSYPNYLKDLLKKADITDFEKLEEFFSTELQNTSFQDQASANYFFFLARQSLLYTLLRRDSEGFKFCVELIRHRMLAVKNMPSIDADLNSWNQLLDFASVSFLRLIKNKPLEDFEERISSLDWGSLSKPFISIVSTIIGMVYVNEDENEQSAKARLWLQKSINESPVEQNLANYFFLAEHFLAEKNADSIVKIEEILKTVEEKSQNTGEPFTSHLFACALLEMRAAYLPKSCYSFNDPLTRLEHCQIRLRDLELDLKARKNLPGFTRSFVENMIAVIYGDLNKMTEDDIERQGFGKKAVEFATLSVKSADALKDPIIAAQYRLVHAALSVNTLAPFTEKDIKEIVQHHKKSDNYPLYVQSVQVYLNLLERNDQTQKSNDILQDLLKHGSKQLESGGFYLIIQAFKLANKVFLRETEEPGVSWMVHNLASFFQKITAIADSIEHNRNFISKSQIEAFRNEYYRFEPASHFSIKVYYWYQWFEIKMLRLGAIINSDAISLKISEKLLSEIEDNNNPLSFMKADWEEFKDVPNSVRNKTLNKCINISKGDLPLAAEHLDFSYRNLRSYITFKEVNRLGFFLDIQETTNRQLEQGIRLMFFDLYKDGTIFEVVFDMPKFLVNYAQSGFYSQDLERELKIKGTTAKKYIKIMIEVKLIRQDKTTGRKHYYRLIRENVMNRLGQDQTTLIK
ncbi:MAG: hypothetical protein SF052_12875 [Bacteroidia bacterium]|nr:hypothetical protein [Bacteroidia bacterium]